MRKLLFIAILCMSSVSFAGDHALGLILGSPTGLSYRYQLKENVQIDSGLDYQLGEKAHLFASYNLLQPDQLKILGQLVNWYYGGGTRIKVREKDDKNETLLGVRGTSGLIFMPKTKPFEIMAQLSPVLNLIPETSVDLDFTLGVRFVF